MKEYLILLMMSRLVNNKELNKDQQFDLDLDRAHREIASLNQKLYHARKNLEDEKRKRRSIERYRNLLENHINMATEILFHDRGIKLDERVKEKLQFLNKFMIEIKHNPYIKDKQNEGQLTTITETDSTGSILSDLNCLSKSEDDLDAEAVIKFQKQIEYKEYKVGDDCSIEKQCNTLDKVAEFNSPNRLTIAKIMSKTDTCTKSFENQVVSSKESVDTKLSNAEASANHSFASKLVIKPETCTVCGKRIRFGKAVPKCKDCNIICHAECKSKVLACIRRKSAICNIAK